jgi:serine/threonine-protein kinase PRP4
MKTDCLVSPFYRPPEVILGYLPLDGAVDVWSAAVTLFELYTGKFLFPGTTNNALLRLQIAALGKPPQKMIKKGIYSGAHFNEQTQQFNN